VASFFISRVDAAVDARLAALGTPEADALKGKAAVAQGVMAYQLFLKTFSGPRFATVHYSTLQYVTVQYRLYCTVQYTISYTTDCAGAYHVFHSCIVEKCITQYLLRSMIQYLLCADGRWEALARKGRGPSGPCGPPRE